MHVAVWEATVRRARSVGFLKGGPTPRGDRKTRQVIKCYFHYVTFHCITLFGFIYLSFRVAEPFSSPLPISLNFSK